MYLVKTDVIFQRYFMISHSTGNSTVYITIIMINILYFFAVCYYLTDFHVKYTFFFLIIIDLHSPVKLSFKQSSHKKSLLLQFLLLAHLRVLDIIHPKQIMIIIGNALAIF